MRRYSEAKSDVYRKNMQALMTMAFCPECHGGRLKPYPAACRFSGKTIAKSPLLRLENWSPSSQTSNLAKRKSNRRRTDLGDQLQRRLPNEVGLHYLTLDRSSPTLSGGEAQRVRLASQIGSGFVGITYILDEPSIGLHPRDNHKLIETLKHLRNLGNTVLVVEHDEETIFAADHIIDVGPGPGYKGGEIIVDGTLKDLLSTKQSVTGAYLRGDKKSLAPKKTKNRQRVPRNHRRKTQQPAKCRRQNPARRLCRSHRSFGLGQVVAYPRHALSGPLQYAAQGGTHGRRHTKRSEGSNTSTK